MEGGGRDRNPITREPTAEEQIDRAARQDTIAAAETRNTIGVITLIAGGVITAGGLTWLFLDSRSAAATKKTTAFRATPRAISLGWRF